MQIYFLSPVHFRHLRGFLRANCWPCSRRAGHLAYSWLGVVGGSVRTRPSTSRTMPAHHIQIMNEALAFWEKSCLLDIFSFVKMKKGIFFASLYLCIQYLITRLIIAVLRDVDGIKCIPTFVLNWENDNSENLFCLWFPLSKVVNIYVHTWCTGTSLSTFSMHWHFSIYIRDALALLYLHTRCTGTYLSTFVMHWHFSI